MQQAFPWGFSLPDYGKNIIFISTATHTKISVADTAVQIFKVSISFSFLSIFFTYSPSF